MIGRLPTSLAVGGIDYKIRTDYRIILDIFSAFQDENLTMIEKWFVALYMLYEDFENADDLEKALDNGFDMEEAIEKANWFMCCGQENTGKKESKPVYDWEKDEQTIFSAVNKVAGQEVRQVDYIHWWTFLGYFNEIGEGTFSYIVGIRRKLNKGEKLEKSERKFYQENKELIDIKRHITAEEKEYIDYMNNLLS